MKNIAKNHFLTILAWQLLCVLSLEVDLSAVQTYRLFHSDTNASSPVIHVNLETVYHQSHFDLYSFEALSTLFQGATQIHDLPQEKTNRATLKRQVLNQASTSSASELSEGSDNDQGKQGQQYDTNSHLDREDDSGGYEDTPNSKSFNIYDAIPN